MDAWATAAARLQTAHDRHMHILATLAKMKSVQMAHDGADEARILFKLKAVVEYCAQKQDFSEFGILCADMSSPNVPRACPICQENTTAASRSRDHKS